MDSILQQLIATSWIEWLAFLFGVSQVVLAWLNKLLNFWFGLFSVCFYTYLFYGGGLYAESLLNLYYIFISIWGILSWQKKESTTIAISTLSIKQWMYSFFIAAIVWFILYIVLVRFTDSTVPVWDALVSSLAWVGSWLLVRRKLENWLLLSLSNVLAIPLQWSKGLELTALLTVIYLLIGILGYLRWKKEIGSVFKSNEG